MRAVLFASATATTSGGRRRRSPITHGSAFVAFDRSRLALAPLMSSRRSQCRQAIVLALRPAILDCQVPALDIAGFPQSIVKRAQTVAKQVGPFGAEHSDHRHRRLLRARRERPAGLVPLRMRPTYLGRTPAAP